MNNTIIEQVTNINDLDKWKRFIVATQKETPYIGNSYDSFLDQLFLIYTVARYSHLYVLDPKNWNGIVSIEGLKRRIDDIYNTNERMCKTLSITNFVLRAKYHGTGQSDLLMDHVLNIAKKELYSCVMLTVLERNTRAISFYKKHGFKEDGSRVLPSKDIDIYMTKQI